MSRSLAPSAASLLALAAGLAAAGCGPGQKATLPAAPAADAAVGVRAVAPRSAAAALSRLTGELRARHEATLYAEASGRIDRFRADVGQAVRKGDVLVEMDRSAAAIGVEQARAAKGVAEAALENAQAALRRTEDLARGEAASAAALEQATIGVKQARAAVAQAAAALAGAEDRLADHAIRAPFDGVVTARLKSAGEYVATVPPTPLLALVDPGSVEVRVQVPEAAVELLRPGLVLPATVSPSGKPFRARVRALGAAVDPQTRTVDVRADVEGEVFAALRPGALAQIEIPAAGEGLFLPAATVHAEGGEAPWVWLVEAERVTRRPVEVDRVGPGIVRVRAGLGEGDLVVADGAPGLADGARVKVLP
jgi:RND family efflux transporter MFP subunit